MTAWRPQHYRQRGRDSGVPDVILDNAIEAAKQVKAVNAALPPIFSLRHLAHILDVDFGFLRAVASRRLAEPYHVFRVKKPRKYVDRGFRVICIPSPALMTAQRWISNRVLTHVEPHSTSFAYAKGSSIFEAAEQHCGSRWLIKLDVRRFFESISEIAVYRVFRKLGYQALVSFELSRICTRLGGPTHYRSRHRWQAKCSRYLGIESYKNHRIGHLPQGAPTSPMLSNLCMQGFDENVARIAEDAGLIYSRYADDICLSTKSRDYSRSQCRQTVGNIYKEMSRHGLTPNIAKTRIVPPGARKMVLGLLVDGEEPRLSREFRSRIRQHLYYLSHNDIGPAKHAANRGFASVIGLRNHVSGLVSFAESVSPDLGKKYRENLNMVHWPM